MLDKVETYSISGGEIAFMEDTNIKVVCILQDTRFLNQLTNKGADGHEKRV